MDRYGIRSVNQSTSAGWQRMLAGMLVCLLVCVSGVKAASTAMATKKCSIMNPSLDEIIYYSDAVLLGEVLRHIPDPNSNATFTVEMQVYCVYKSIRPVPTKINITNAGSPQGACFNTVFSVGIEYVAYLKETGVGKHVFTPAFQHDPSDYVDEIQVTCNINITYPEGINVGNALRSCEREEEYDDYEYEDDMKVEDEPCVPFVPEDKTTEVEKPEVETPEVKTPEVKTPEVKTPKPTSPEAESGEDESPKNPDAEPKTDAEAEPEVEVGTGGDSNDRDDSGKEVPYQSGKTGKIENPVNDDGDSEPENGSVPLRMSLALTALIYGVVLLLS